MKQGVRAELDERNEKIGYKIRYARQEDKVPYMLIIGEKEISEGTLAVRDRATDQTTSMSMEELVAKLEKEIAERL
jgi:threonyl-tRNA synthetase